MKRISQVQRVLNTDIQKFESMTRAELAHEVSILASAANKRIKRLESQGYNTPAVLYTKRQGGNFSVKGKNKTQLLNEMKRAKGFLGAKTSTISGAKESISSMNKIISKQIATEQARQKAMQSKDYSAEIEVPEEFEMVELSKEQMDEYWRAIDRLREMHPAQFNAICLQYVGRIENYVERGRTGNQAASYISRAIKKIEREAISKQNEVEEAISRLVAGFGDNNIGNNNL